MQFKIDNNLIQVVAGMAEPKDQKVVTRELCQRFVDAGLLKPDDPDNYGEPAIRVIGPEHAVEIHQILADYLGVANIETKVYDAFCHLSLLGDGDCPVCGGRLKFVETEGHELRDGDYYCPPSYVIDKYVYKCQVCGEIVKLDKEL